MTAVEFSVDTGHLRLDRDRFEQLAQWYIGPDDPGLAELVLAPLRAVGAVDPAGELAPPLATALATVADAVCQLTIEIRDPQRPTESARGWVNGQAATLLLPLTDGRYELGMVHPSFLPAMLLRILALGPRPRLASSVPLPASSEQLDQLTDADPARRAVASAGLPGTARLRRDWQVRATWRPAEGSAGVRVVRVLDTAEGLWLVETHQSRVMLFPTAPSAVFRALVTLLPTDEELAPPSG